MTIKERYHKLKTFYSKCISLYANTDKENIIKVIIPALIVTVGFYACTQARSEAQKNVKDIFVIADNIRSNYVGKADYWGVSTSSVINNNMLSKKFISNNKIVLQGHKEILIGNGANADIVMPQSQTFDIILKGLNKSQCIAYAEVKIDNERLISVSKISIVNETGQHSFEWGGKNSLPIKNYASKDFCIDTDNTLIWSMN